MAASRLEGLRLGLSRWLLSPLQGATLDVWRGVSKRDSHEIAPAFWPRAALTTLSAALNSRAARREAERYRPEWERIEVREPVFILGHYRSGTTHLHNLLAADPRFAYPDNYQANFPRTFLTTEESGKRLGAFFTMRKRPHDNVALNLDVPTEDELAICADTLLSPHMDWHFPRAGGRYTRRYLDLRDASAPERERWVESLRTFARKLTLRHDRPLVLKSPLHTARIPLLLEAFPDARFVHVRRDPFEVFRSTRRMELKVEPLFRFQHSDFSRLDERILDRYRRMYDLYLRERAAIPAGRLVEIGYERLVSDPVGTLETVYGALGLPDFASAREPIERYLGAIAGYRRNIYPPLGEATVERIAQAWEATFAEWGYEPVPARDRHGGSMGS